MGQALAAWLLVTAAAATPVATTPREVVQSAVIHVIAVLEEARAPRQGPSAATLPARERTRGELRRIAADLFDFEEISRRAQSRHWAGRSRTEQQEFVALFTALLERSYVGKDRLRPRERRW